MLERLVVTVCGALLVSGAVAVGCNCINMWNTRNDILIPSRLLSLMTLEEKRRHALRHYEEYDRDGREHLVAQKVRESICFFMVAMCLAAQALREVPIGMQRS
jgi:hypothetical protein